MEQIFELILAATFGAIFGSYATLFAYRLPLGESCFGRYFGPKSRCPECGSTILTRDLIPLLNWVFTLGRCRKCKTKIPRTHLFIEFSTTIAFLLCYLKFSFSEEFIIYAMISVGLIILLACDYTHKVFPDQILNFILVAGLANRILQERQIMEAIFSAAIGIIFAAIFYQIFYKKTRGFFASEKQAFDYTKFILVASICFKLNSFLFYFLVLMIILIAIILFNIPNKKHPISFGYVLIIPFMWLMLYPPAFLI